MSSPVDELKQEVREQKPKVLFAAGLAGVLLLLSLTVAGGTLYLIVRGDQGTAARNTLPADCDWAVETHAETDPVELLGRLGRVRLPHPASALTAVMARELPRVGAGIDVDSGVAVCGRKDAVVWSVGLASADDVPAAKAIAEQGRGGRWTPTAPVGGFTELWLERDGRKVAAILHTEERAVIAISRADRDAAEILAEVVQSTRKLSLRDAKGFREGVERVGGTVRLWMKPEVAGRLVRKPWLEHAHWYAASVRDDAGELVIHSHIGGGHRLFDASRKALDERGEVQTPHKVMVRWAIVHTGVAIEMRPL